MPVDAFDRLAEFAAALRPRLVGELRLDELHRALYSTDASLYRVVPQAIARPRNSDDLLAILSRGEPVVQFPVDQVKATWQATLVDGNA